MSKTSTSPAAEAAGRVAGRMARRNRYVFGAWSAISSAASTFSRVLRRLWHEVTGFLFLVFALIFAGTAWHEYHRSTSTIPSAGVGRTLLAAAFSVLFIWFGVSSFWRARRVEKR